MSDHDELKPTTETNAEHTVPDSQPDSVDETTPDTDEILKKDGPDGNEFEEFSTSDHNSLAYDHVVSETDDFGLSDDNALNTDLDIDAALESVASLSDVIAEREAEEAAEHVRQEAEARAIQEAQARRAAYYLPRPPLATLERGQIASVIPALVLITIGTWLTFAFTLADTPPDPIVVILACIGGLGITLISHWLTSGRWARGTLFGGLALIATSGSLIYLTLENSPGVRGWPLVIVALGGTILISSLLSRSSSTLQTLAGLLIIIAGGASLAVTTEQLPQDILTLTRTFGPIVLIIALALMLIPAFLNRRR